MGLHNMAGMSTATTGTGTITLGAALTGLQTFAAAGVVNGEVVPYSIKDGANFEVGIGTYNSSGPTLARTTIYGSSNGGAAINLSGNAKVRITILKESMPPAWKLTVNESGSSFANFTGNSGTWASNSGVIKQTDASAVERGARYNTKIDTHTFIMEAEIQLKTNGADSRGGILVGYGGSTQANSFTVTLRRGFNTVMVVLAGVDTLVSFSSTINIDQWYKLKAKVAGGRISVYLDDVLLGTYGGMNTSVNADSSYVGLYTYQSEVWYRNIKVWNLVSPEDNILPLSAFSDLTEEASPASADLLVLEKAAGGKRRMPASVISSILPESIMVWAEQFSVLSGLGGSLVVEIVSSQNYTVAVRPTTPGDGGVIGTSIALAAGTYDFIAMGITFTNKGKIDWSLDNASPFIVGQDWYSSGGTAVRNVYRTGTMTVSKAGRHILKATVNGKNASSSGFDFQLTFVMIRAQTLTTKEI